MNSCFHLQILIETFYIQECNMPKVKVTVTCKFAATKIIDTPQKDQDEMLLSSFVYSSITVSVNISNKLKKWGSIFFHMKIQKKTK